MAKVIFLLGLAGSGKTVQADKLERENGTKKFEGIAGSHYPNGVKEVIEHLKSDKDCTVEEIKYCCEINRNEIVNQILSNVPFAKIEWYCLENDLQSANWNVEARTHKSSKEETEAHLRINVYWHKCYTYPTNVELKPIVRKQ